MKIILITALITCGAVVLIAMTGVLFVALRSIRQSAAGRVGLMKSARVITAYSLMLLLGFTLIWLGVHFAKANGYLHRKEGHARFYPSPLAAEPDAKAS